jgi:hypothetical protein
MLDRGNAVAGIWLGFLCAHRRQCARYSCERHQLPPAEIPFPRHKPEVCPCPVPHSGIFFLLLDGERRGKRVDEAHVALAGDEARKDPAKSPTDRPDCLFFIPFPRRVAALAHVV